MAHPCMKLKFTRNFIFEYHEVLYITFLYVKKSVRVQVKCLFGRSFVILLDVKDPLRK